MTSDQIRNALRSEPFKPFVLKTTGGRQYPVRHPEMVLLSPSGRTLALADSEDTFVVIDVLMVESLNPMRNGQNRRRKAS
jgi:hypothetical protein